MRSIQYPARSLQITGSPAFAGDDTPVSKPDLVAALERKDFARLVRAREREPEPFHDLARLLDLHGVRLGKLAGPDPQRILEADAHVAAHGGRHGGDRHLVAAGAEHGPVV